MANNVSTSYQYPFPADPSRWGHEERQYSMGLRHLFDILFARKLQNVMIADRAITARNIADGSIRISHVVPGFGSSLDISGNGSITDLTDAVEEAQDTADDAADTAEEAKQKADDAVDAVVGLPDILMPVGITVICDTAPEFGTWAQTTVGDLTAWTRTQ